MMIGSTADQELEWYFVRCQANTTLHHSQLRSSGKVTETAFFLASPPHAVVRNEAMAILDLICPRSYLSITTTPKSSRFPYSLQ